MTYARIVAGRFAGRSGEVVRSRGWYVWVATTGGVVCVHMRDMRDVPRVDPIAVARYRERLLKGVPGKRRR